MICKMKTFTAACLATMMAFGMANTVLAAGGSSGPAVKYAKQGQIGEVITNPYRIAPLTAIIRSGGYKLDNVKVRIVPKQNGSEIAYKVDRSEVLTHGGIPVFGLYPDYVNTVEVSYTRIDALGAKKDISETYKIYAPPVYTEGNGSVSQKSTMFDTEVVKMSEEFKDRLYLVNNLLVSPPKGSRVIWNNPAGGALEWCFYPQNAIIDASGEVRWYLMADPIYDMQSIYKGGVMMGFQQGKDGALTWGYGQRYVKYDIMGREVFNRMLPEGYDDFSHSLDPMQNGNYLIRVSDADYLRPDGKRVRTIRDVIIEVDQNGRMVDEWNLNNILDTYRSDVIKTLDQGAVCLNIDVAKAGVTMSADELAELDQSDKFGDILGTGAGRNWAHVNSVDYDPTDDSIIISSRHQSAIVKIGRDKKVKWIIGSHQGWKGELAKKLLTPVDAQGNPIKCDEGCNTCEQGFDWTWTQHTAWRIDSKSKKGVVYLTVFDNGDGRGMEQPALPSEKYTRLVVYKVDEAKMTIEQVWQYGVGMNEIYSPVTGLCEYQADKDSIVGYFSTAGMKVSKGVAVPSPYVTEFEWGAKDPSVKIHILNSFGYQAMPFHLDQAFGTAK